MNDRAREVLVAAALAGHRQIKYFMHFPGDLGDCALGVLHLALHQTRKEACDCMSTRGKSTRELQEAYALTRKDYGDITEANDDLGWDLLTIARKVGVTNEAE